MGRKTVQPYIWSFVLSSFMTFGQLWGRQNKEGGSFFCNGNELITNFSSKNMGHKYHKKISILVHNIRKSTPLKYAAWISCITLLRRTLLPWSIVYYHLPIGTVCTGNVMVALSAKIATPFFFFFLTINMTSACCTVGYRRPAMATATSWCSTWKLNSPLDLMMRFDNSTCHSTRLASSPFYSACQLATLLGLPARHVHSSRLASLPFDLSLPLTPTTRLAIRRSTC